MSRPASPHSKADRPCRPASNSIVVERELVGRVDSAGRLGQGGRQLLVVERRLSRPVLGVDQDELSGAAGQVVAIPETVVPVETSAV